MAFRFIAANDHPDHDTIATFRRRFLADIEQLFVKVLALAREAGMLKLGTVALDGTKVHANASRHRALSYEHVGKIEAQLRAEVQELMALAEATDQADVPDGMSVPEELARREQRLQRIAEAKAAIEARAKERFLREEAEHQAKLQAREEKAKKTGRKPGGRPPQPPMAGPGPTDQVNLTDEDSRIMPVAGGGFEQAYNARPRWRRAACWWSPTMWFKPPMTSSRSHRRWTSSPLLARRWGAPRPCWPIAAISVKRTSRPARKPGSRR